MADEPRTGKPPAEAPTQVTAASPPPGPTINIGDEFGTAKRNLPPAKIVLLAVGAVLIVVAVVAFFQRAKPLASGSLDAVSAVAIPNQTAMLVALTFTLRNSPDKPLWVRTIQGTLKTPNGDMTSEAVSAIDFDRYFLAFPALKAGTLPALSPEDKLQPGQEVKRTVIVSFPVTEDGFEKRQSVSVVIQPYDQPVPVVLTR